MGYLKLLFASTTSREGNHTQKRVANNHTEYIIIYSRSHYKQLLNQVSVLNLSRVPTLNGSDTASKIVVYPTPEIGVNWENTEADI